MSSTALALLIFIAFIALTALFTAVTAMLRQSEARQAQAEAGATKAATRGDAEACRWRETPERVLDLADWPVLLDLKKVETFFQECSTAFPRQREIWLPLGTVDRFCLSEVPLTAELQLRETIRRH